MVQGNRTGSASDMLTCRLLHQPFLFYFVPPICAKAHRATSLRMSSNKINHVITDHGTHGPNRCPLESTNGLKKCTRASAQQAGWVQKAHGGTPAITGMLPCNQSTAPLQSQYCSPVVIVQLPCNHSTVNVL